MDKARKFLQEHRWISAAIALTLLGIIPRSIGYFTTLDLWYDEAWWGMRATDGYNNRIRPPGYMQVHEWLLAVHNSEEMLRIVSYLFGILCIPAFFYLAKRFTKNYGIVVFGSYLLALNQAHIGMSKEFKPYAMECFLHIALLLGAAIYFESRRRRFALFLCASALLAASLSWSVLFVYPALFLVLFYVAWQKRDRMLLAIVATSAVLINVYYFAIYKLRHEGAARTGAWARKYDVFASPKSASGGIEWYVEKTGDWLGFPGRLLTIFDADNSHDTIVLIASILAALGMLRLLIKGQSLQRILVFVPLITFIAIHATGYWPYGLFRTNLFLLPYALIAIVSVFDAGVPRLPMKAQVLCLGIAAVLLLPPSWGRFQVKKGHDLGNSTSVRAAVVDAMDAPDAKSIRRLEVGPLACKVLKYYVGYHTNFVATRSQEFHDRFGKLSCKDRGVKDRKALRKRFAKQRCEDTFFLVAASRFHKVVDKHAQKYCSVVNRHEYDDGTLLLQCRASTQSDCPK